MVDRADLSVTGHVSPDPPGNPKGTAPMRARASAEPASRAPGRAEEAQAGVFFAALTSLSDR